jgi:MFS family permease
MQAMNNWLPLLATLFIQAMVAMALLTLPVMAPVAAKDLGVSPALVGFYVSITYAGAMFASLTSGTTVSRFGPIRVSQLGLLLCALGLLLCASPWLPFVALGALLIGLGYGPITPASSQILARTTPPDQMGLVFSIKQTGVPVGAMMAGAIVPSLLLAINWQWSLVIVALACLLSAVMAQPLRIDFDDLRQANLPFQWGTLANPIRMVLGHRALATMAACSFMFSMVQMSLTTYLVTYLHDDLAYGLVSAGLLLSVTQMGGIAGRIFVGRGGRQMARGTKSAGLVGRINGQQFSGHCPAPAHFAHLGHLDRLDCVWRLGHWLEWRLLVRGGPAST